MTVVDFLFFGPLAFLIFMLWLLFRDVPLLEEEDPFEDWKPAIGDRRRYSGVDIEVASTAGWVSPLAEEIWIEGVKCHHVDEDGVIHDIYFVRREWIERFG